VGSAGDVIPVEDAFVDEDFEMGKGDGRVPGFGEEASFALAWYFGCEVFV
jgi:hypothetical protein